MSTMGRLIRIAVLSIAIIAFALAIIVALIPFALKNKAVKLRIEEAIQSKTGLDVKLGKTRPIYLPRPCIEFDHITIKRQNIAFKAVGVRFYPDLMALITPDKTTLPLHSISFEKGVLSRELSLRDGKISIQGEVIRFSTQCNVEGMCDFSLAGDYDRLRKHISLDLVGGRTDIGSLMKATFKEGRLSGLIATSFRIDIDADLNGKGPYRINIDHLDLEHPGLEANGTIAIRKKAKDLLLDIDVMARSVAVDQIRPLLTRVFPHEKAIKETVEIVRGGNLDSFHLRFQGTKEGLRHFKNYVIAATGRNVPIYIPKIDLLIDKVSGSVEIKKEVLRGKGLEARVRQTRGHECSIRLDLGGKHKKLAFKGRLSAPSGDILWAVKKFVKEREVLAWAGNITSSAGGAHGTLEIKGPLKHLKVAIKARPESLKVRIKGLQDVVGVSGGSFYLDTKSQVVGLRSVSGGMDAIKCKAVDGEIGWGKARAFDITLRGVELDLNSLHDLLAGLKIGSRLRGKVRDVKGHLSLTKAHFKGTFPRPKGLFYEVNLGGGSGTLDTPFLPMVASFKGPFGTITNGRIRLSRLVMGFSDNTTLELDSAMLSHAKGHIKGVDVAVSGHVGTKVGEWALKKAKVPEEFRPKLPLNIEALKASLNGQDEVSITGKFSKKAATKGEVKVSLRLLKKRGLIQVEGVKITGPHSHATIKFRIREGAGQNGGSTSLDFSYQGELAGNDLNTFLEQNKLLMGRLKGDLTLAIGGLDHPRIVGTLNATGLLWNWGVSRPIFIEALATRTKGSGLEITHVLLQEGGNKVEGMGNILGTERGFSIDFNAIDGRVDIDSVMSLLGHGPPPKGQIAKEKARTEIIPQRETHKIKWPRFIRDAKIKFDIHQAYFKKKAIEAPSGVLVLGEDGHLTLDVYASRICGLKAALNLNYTRNGPPMASVRIWTGDRGLPPDFSTTLPCLGVTKDLIDGPIWIDASLEGIPGNWDKGHFKLKGGPGIIKRSYVIAKIFAIINVTGLFNKNLFKADLPYSVFEVTGHVKGEKVGVERFVLKAEGLNFFGRGEIRLSEGTLDLFVLVSPFKTFDYILSKIPILGYAIGGRNRTLLTVPLKVSGPIEDPNVTVLHPEAIGKGMLDLFKNIISIPIRVVVPEGLSEGEQVQ